jgi:hypothetical protein
MQAKSDKDYESIMIGSRRFCPENFVEDSQQTDQYVETDNRSQYSG